MLLCRLPFPIAHAPVADPSGAGGATPLDRLLATLDADAVQRLRQLDPTGAAGLLPRVLKAFEGSLQRLLVDLHEARSSGDWSKVRHVTHTLKSSSASVGALELSRSCAEIEARIRQEQVDGLTPWLDGMVVESERLLALLGPALAGRT
ncbi:Hpt domain-containing protein [Aquabacterium sp. J223]|uniref:Hpt domain-containing protein n=1 Tax=Aquabacterium sp. J223 TaxID=2898431 RepID=UPI0021AE1FFB|nr:Hpt domain-containing protein [Aquabacterium sp. J223]UUX97569.1 Hpt domain-containing protein [Aquabacterium sp. J223]